MRRIKFAVIAGILPAVIIVMAALSARAQDLPDGPGRAEVETQCSTCHSLARITSHKDSLEGWRGIVDTMVGMGAMFTDGDKELIVNYLFKSFSDKAPESAPPGTANPSTPTVDSPAAKVDPSRLDLKLGEGVAAEFIQASCVQCHALSRITVKGGRTKAEWAEVVERMVKLGAQLNDLKSAMVIDYLTAAFPK